MSTVTLILIRHKQLFVIEQHYRVIEHLLQKGPETITVVKAPCRSDIDAGYIIYDCDEHLIINAQYAFAIEERKNYCMIRLY
jgi:hypothetical protein